MPTLTIDGQKIEVAQGTTIIEAASMLQIDVPHFCYHPALSRPANCRMCLVEVERAPKLQPACYSQVMEGMVVHTRSEKVVRARKAVLEFILLNHPIDCPICDQAGECKLQDYYFTYSAQESRQGTRKVNKVKVFPIGPEVVYDGERCILCTRCVRFCEEVTQTSELTTVQRADMSEIRTFPGMELDNDYSLCTVDLCPVGALTDRDFRFKCRVWYLKTTPSICTGCAKGCNIHLEHFKDEAQRYRPRPNPEVNQWWMCDRGRRTYRDLHTDRMLSPRAQGQGDIPTQRAIGATIQHLRAFRKSHDPSTFAIALSPQSPCEDLYALLDLATRAIGTRRLYISGKPNDAFTLRRDPSQVSDSFLIQADKNPNRAGLLRLAESFGLTPQPISDLASDIASGLVQGLYLSSPHTPLRGDDLTTLWSALSTLPLLIYAGHTPGSWGPGRVLADAAHVSLPTCTHAEMDGSFVNIDGLHQPFSQAFAPHGLSQPEWQWASRVALRLSGAAVEDLPTLRARTTQALAAPAPSPTPPPPAFEADPPSAPAEATP
jgi:NADH-quinone oxidoreductase subunit G